MVRECGPGVTGAVVVVASVVGVVVMVVPDPGTEPEGPPRPGIVEPGPDEPLRPGMVDVDDEPVEPVAVFVVFFGTAAAIVGWLELFGVGPVVPGVEPLEMVPLADGC